MNDLDLARLKQLADGATPGPWKVYEHPVSSREKAIAELTAQVNETAPMSDTLYLLNANGKCPATTGCGPTSKANAAYIAALSPDVVKALIERVERAEAALRPFANMLPDNIVTKDALQEQLQQWCRAARTTLAALETK